MVNGWGGTPKAASTSRVACAVSSVVVLGCDAAEACAVEGWDVEALRAGMWKPLVFWGHFCALALWNHFSGKDNLSGFWGDRFYILRCGSVRALELLRLGL
eukprot:2167592-Amphidinium_carterae.1